MFQKNPDVLIFNRNNSRIKFPRRHKLQFLVYNKIFSTLGKFYVTTKSVVRRKLFYYYYYYQNIRSFYSHIIV